MRSRLNFTHQKFPYDLEKRFLSCQECRVTVIYSIAVFEPNAHIMYIQMIIRHHHHRVERGWERREKWMQLLNLRLPSSSSRHNHNSSSNCWGRLLLLLVVIAVGRLVRWVQVSRWGSLWWCWVYQQDWRCIHARRILCSIRWIRWNDSDDSQLNMGPWPRKNGKK